MAKEKAITIARLLSIESPCNPPYDVAAFVGGMTPGRVKRLERYKE
jgi:hypothetical protein